MAGAIAGNGYDSSGDKSGIAPDASLVSLKVLNAKGIGTVSNIITAFDWVLANHKKYNIRVVNLSVGAAVTESYWTDPLALAAKRVVDAGVVVVAAAGNFGKNDAGLAAVWRHQRARQLPMGHHGRCVEHERHVEPQGRHDGVVQLAWADLHRLGREARPGGAGPRHRLAGGARKRVLPHQALGSVAWLDQDGLRCRT